MIRQIRIRKERGIGVHIRVADLHFRIHVETPCRLPPPATSILTRGLCCMNAAAAFVTSGCSAVRAVHRQVSAEGWRTASGRRTGAHQSERDRGGRAA